jgi:putative acyl-CoA dehydrogenase
MPRLYRESPLNAIWEGSGNVMALDLVRVLGREPDAVEALRIELDQARGIDTRLDTALDFALDSVRSPIDAEYEARRLIEALALAAGGALVAQHAGSEVWDAFATTRLAGDWGQLFGTLPRGIDTRAILEPASPRLA